MSLNQIKCLAPHSHNDKLTVQLQEVTTSYSDGLGNDTIGGVLVADFPFLVQAVVFIGSKLILTSLDLGGQQIC